MASKDECHAGPVERKVAEGKKTQAQADDPGDAGADGARGQHFQHEAEAAQGQQQESDIGIGDEIHETFAPLHLDFADLNVGQLQRLLHRRW